ncbi:MAG: hypothetical protein P8K67_00040, partial [Candidatus Marinimicrobia bacterium]|nr:hypothetical protein [Candidatus Neomarinimicrobiota bacterium]
MEEKIIIADFTLTKDSCDNFFGEIDLNDTILTYYHNKFIKVYGKAYDFDDKQKSYIKLKFIDMDERQDFFSRDNEGFYEYCDYKDLPDISFEERYNENDNVIEFDEVGEIGEGKIYLENSKISPRSPDFSGKCKIRNCRELDSKNWNVSLDYNFEVIGWYSKKILNDELKINLKINYDEDENCEDWLQESNKTNSYKIKEI